MSSAIDFGARQGAEPPFAEVFVPVRTVSEANRHEHWRYRQKRAKAQSAAAWMSCQATVCPGSPWSVIPDPIHVHIERQAPRKLDSDNLAGSQKHVRDGVAKWLGMDDGDESRITFSYGQAKAKTYAVKLSFYRRK